MTNYKMTNAKITVAFGWIFMRNFVKRFDTLLSRSFFIDGAVQQKILRAVVS